MVLLKELPGNQVVIAAFLCQVEIERTRKHLAELCDLRLTYPWMESWVWLQILHIYLPKVCMNSLLLVPDFPRESCEDAQVVCRHASAEGRAAERALGQRKNRKWQQYLTNCTLCTVSKEQNYRATGPFLCALPCSRTFLFPWVRHFCWVWASPGCTCCGDSPCLHIERINCLSCFL